MANENKEIGEIVKKCKILLLDIEGTTTSISFVKDKLFPYAEENVKQYLESQWETEDVKSAVSALRKLALEDQEKSVEGVVAIPAEDASKEDQIEGLVKNVKWQMSSDRKVGPLKLLQGLIWKQGYDKGEIKGHVYDDVSPALEQWRSVDGQKVYIYSSGSVAAQKLLFGQSVAGDLLKLIDGHFDTGVGAKQEAASYAAIAKEISCKPEEILFLTDIVKEAEAALSAGLQALLVSRAGNAALPEPAAAPVLLSLAQLAQPAQPSSNKRKPDDAQDETPAKVPKTDIEDDVKSSLDAEKKETEVKADVKVVEEKVESTEKKTEDEKPDQMEVVEEPSNGTETIKENKVEDVPMEGVVVEDVTDTKEPLDVPESDAKPIINEEKEKTEEKETEKMDAVVVEAEESSKPNGTAEIKNGDVNVAEETPPAVEIEEVSEKHNLADVGEIIDGIEPVIEEPPVVDMEELQNVGEVLEKECDEILSKVQDVTNLDNVPLKPLLNPIAEETMETENADSNDIVDRILDTELELEMKQCEDIDLNTVQEITEPKENAKEKIEKVETDTGKSEKTPEVVAENNVTDGNASSSPTETKSDEIKTEVTKTKETKPEETKLEENKTDETKTKENKKEEVKLEESKIENGNDTTPEATAVAEKKVEESKEEANKVAEPIEKEAKETKVESKVENGAEEKIEKKEKDLVPEAKANDVEEKEKPKVNGKATNGDAEVNLNGDSAEELKSRLSVEENGKKPVNGSNGDAAPGQGACKPEPELADIKVKTVADVAAAGGEPRTDPIEQPTEA